eukprot:2729730-Pleurochrysis_carterae.AAC.1
MIPRHACSLLPQPCLRSAFAHARTKAHRRGYERRGSYAFKLPIFAYVVATARVLMRRVAHGCVAALDVSFRVFWTVSRPAAEQDCLRRAGVSVRDGRA